MTERLQIQTRDWKVHVGLFPNFLLRVSSLFFGICIKPRSWVYCLTVPALWINHFPRLVTRWRIWNLAIFPNSPYCWYWEICVLLCAISFREIIKFSGSVTASVSVNVYIKVYILIIMDETVNNGVPETIWNTQQTKEKKASKQNGIIIYINYIHVFKCGIWYFVWCI